MGNLVRAILVACAIAALLGFSGDVAAAPCGKNHFILDEPVPCMAVDVADTWNRRIRAITPDGVVRTVAGNGK